MHDQIYEDPVNILNSYRGREIFAINLKNQLCGKTF
jgi:hypothetical protein